MNSWEVSACYPQRTFYPLSDGLSIKNHRITRTDLRPCSTCTSYSQANIYSYALLAISNSNEFTFVRLRYSFEGRRPSQTTHHSLSLVVKVSFTKNDTQFSILRITPPTCIFFHSTIKSCRQGAQGLSVQLQLMRIFTHIPISQGPLMRQQESHYVIHAGQ